MKNLFAIIFLFSTLFATAQENSAQLWDKANAFYATESYEEAISAYEQIISGGEESAKLYFNLGNAYYKSGNVNRAILNFERAKLLAPHDEDIAFNLEIANQHVVSKVEVLPKPFFLRWKDSVIKTFPADTWGIISASAFVLFLVFLGLFLFGKTVSTKKLAFWLGIVVFVGSCFTFSFASEQKSKIKNRKHAIVFCPRYEVKSSPSESGTNLFLIYEGVKVEITDSLSTWKEIRLADGKKGWIPENCLEKI